MKEINRTNPIILFGTGRSGTTIFMNALFRHKNLAFLPNILCRQPKWLWLNYFRNFTDNSFFRLFPSKENKILNNFILKPVEGYSIWEYLTKNEFNFRREFLNEVETSKDLVTRVHRYLSETMKNQNRPRFAMKITGPGRLSLLSQLFPSGRFIWLKRDFIPTLHSFLKIDFWQGRDLNELWWSDPKIESILKKYPNIEKDRVLFTAFQLQAIISDIELYIEENDLEILVIDYEEFSENPEKVLSEALSFCSLEPDIDCFNFIKKNEIENRNKKVTEYFDDKTLETIGQLRESFIKDFNRE